MSTEFSPRVISLVRMYTSDITDKIVRLTVESMEKRGIIAAGYDHILIGDRWALPHRDEAGRLVPNPETFPCGIKGLAVFLHEKGLKLGILTSAGAKTQGGAPGCINYEYSDAETFAEWGVDFIFHDTCYIPFKAYVPTLIRRMGMALRACGRSIAYSVYSDEDGLYKWIRSAGANSYCTRGYADAFPVNSPDRAFAGYSASYCFMSLGELFIKNSTPVSEIRRQLALDAIMSSPIIIDCDTCALSEEQLAAVCNTAVTDIARDPEGRPAKAHNDGVYCKMLDGAEYAVAFVNNTDESREFTFYAFDFGILPDAGYTCVAEPLFRPGEAVEFDACLSANIAPGDAEIYRLTLKEVTRK